MDASSSFPPPAQAAELISRREATDLDNALLVLRDRVEHEFRRTERLDNKARQAFALVAGFVALTQAAAFASFGEGEIGSGARVAILVAAILTVCALLVTAFLLFNSERLREEGALPIESVAKWCVEPGSDKRITAWLILAHREVGKNRDKSNAIRAARVKLVLAAAAATLVLSALELVLSMAVRI
jgi:hypothetical protein